jgi:poly(hydroxyalkanoate) depolymerase family esterase
MFFSVNSQTLVLPSSFWACSTHEFWIVHLRNSQNMNGMRWPLLLTIAAMAWSCNSSDDYPGLSVVSNFGANPGDLDMFMFEPSSPTANMPLVVALHGCSQSAADMADLTRWNELGERHGFYVIYPEQRTVNNVSRCFNWFQTKDIDRDQGESRSIHSMVQHMLQNYPIDAQRVFVTGLSAGAAMTSVMLANRPDVFAAGAVFGGGPARAATSMFESVSVMAGNVSKSPEEWGALARSQNGGHTGPFPRLSIYHGTDDDVVSPNNAAELVKQWTDLHGTDVQADDAVSGYQGAFDVQRLIYHDSEGEEVVVRYIISNMGHAIPVHSGACRHQGGETSTFATEKQFFSTYWTAVFFGIVPKAEVAGPSMVILGQTGTVFSAPYYQGSSYLWQLPDGCIITSGEGTSSITVQWGSVPGVVSVMETDTLGCNYPIAGLHVAM